jgi:hypothetical protein
MNTENTETKREPQPVAAEPPSNETFDSQNNNITITENQANTNAFGFPAPGGDQSNLIGEAAHKSINPKQIKEILSLLHPPGSVLEVRAFGCNGKSQAYGGWTRNIVSGYFDNVKMAVDAIEKLERCSSPEAIYVTLNSVDPALLARVQNRLVGSPKAATKDEDVPILRNLLIDFDPARPSGISATEEEMTNAITLRDKVIDHVAKNFGLAPIIKGMSGNGGHAIYRLPDLENSKEHVDLLKQVLVSLSTKFDTENVKIDGTVFNPARITKVLGTMARKGDSTPDRPHRLSYIEDKTND